MHTCTCMTVCFLRLANCCLLFSVLWYEWDKLIRLTWKLGKITGKMQRISRHAILGTETRTDMVIEWKINYGVFFLHLLLLLLSLWDSYSSRGTKIYASHSPFVVMLMKCSNNKCICVNARNRFLINDCYTVSGIIQLNLTKSTILWTTIRKFTEPDTFRFEIETMNAWEVGRKKQKRRIRSEQGTSESSKSQRERARLRK